jgi:hypothetical protein
MDTKLPALSTDKVSEHLGRSAGTEEMTGAGESNPLAKRRITIEEAKAQGLDLSPREIEIAKANGGYVDWVVGSVSNMVKPEAGFIQGANDQAMPLKAGISGTTYRFGQMGSLLGADPALARQAAVGNLTSIDAHSFHEIASASQGFQEQGGKYDSATPYSEGSTGLSQDQLKAIAAKRGLSLDELNNNKKPEAPTVEGPSQ